jgi:hypothetical protein
MVPNFQYYSTKRKEKGGKKKEYDSKQVAI